MCNFKKIKKNKIFSSAFSFIFRNTTDNPYHNNSHLLSVFNNVIKMCKYYDIKNGDRLSLGLSAIFHDFKHNGKIGHDDINIKMAIKGFDTWYNRLDNELKEDIDVNKVYNIIKCTEFPRKNEPKNLKESIIMDADMLSAYTTDWPNTTIIGLSKEYNITVKKQIGNQIEFIKNLKFYTDYAIEIHNSKKYQLIEQLEFLKQII